jgi:hypothetical protein
MTAPGDEAALAPRRPVSANAVAQSLCLPYETVRGRVVSLIDKGWCLREPGGLLVSPSAAARPDYQAAVLDIHAAFLDALRALRRIDFDFDGLTASSAPPPEGPIPSGPPLPGLIVHLVMELQQRHLETITPMFGDPAKAFVWAGALQAHVRRLLVEPESAWAYAGQDAPPPDNLRTPVSVRALAQTLGMPYETVRRHVATLLEEGRLVRVGRRGVLAPAAAVGQDGLGRGNPVLMMRFVRLIAELKRLGFDFADPR